MALDLAFLENRYVFGTLSAVGGIALTLLTQQITNRRALFTYFVRHDRVGVSADNSVFGTVKVTWNDTVVQNLYASTVELTNQSLRDFEKIVVRIYTYDSTLLSEKTEIVGTTHVVRWTEGYDSEVRVQPGQQVTQAQRDTHGSRRDYLIPIMNRGQVVRFHFLNAAKTQNLPTIWIDVLERGIRHQFRVPQELTFGVPRPRAALVGLLLGIALLGWVIATVDTVWIAAVGAFSYGLCAQIPGAWAVRAGRVIRDWFGG